MAYKLMIENVITPLMPVTMTPFYVTLKITNIGDSVFPGGILTVFSVQSQSASRSVSGSKLPKIPPLKSGESLSLEPQSFSMFDGGVTRLLVELKANDDAPVDLFQNLEYNMGEKWLNLFKIVDQEQLKIISLLQKIVELLERGR